MELREPQNVEIARTLKFELMYVMLNRKGGWNESGYHGG